MRNFLKVGAGIATLGILQRLIQHPELWNSHTFRSTYTNTPHAEVDDILLRYSPPDVNNPSAVQNDAAPVWYPEVRLFPEIFTIIANLMVGIRAHEVGRLMITRLTPGKVILPHADTVGRYVNQGDIGRYHVVLQGLPGSLFRCGDETIQMLTGEVWWFDAHKEHEVINNSVDDRIHLIVDLKYWPV